MLAALLLNLPAGGSSGIIGEASFGRGKSDISPATPKKGFRDLLPKSPVYQDSIEEEDVVLMKIIKLFLEGQK